LLKYFRPIFQKTTV